MPALTFAMTGRLGVGVDELLEQRLVAGQAQAAVGADGQQSQLFALRDELRRRHAHHRPQAGLRLARVERHRHRDRQLRDAARALYRRRDLVEIGHRLHMEEIDAALFQRLRLLRERLPKLIGGHLAHHQHLAAGAELARHRHGRPRFALRDVARR